MKYIRAQNGEVLSVSRLIPPKGGSPEGEEIWRLSVVSVDGERYTYAIYVDGKTAVMVYAVVLTFMASITNMLEFELSAEGLPVMLDEWLSAARSSDAQEESDDSTGNTD